MPEKYRSIPDVIKKDQAFSAVRKKALEYDVKEEFKTIFPELATIAKAVKVEKKGLFLHVENSVWRSELNFKKSLIIEKVNNHFNDEVVKYIKFV
jgi:hypothetical protein